MKSRGLLIAAIVLAALTGTLYWSNHRKPAETSVKASAETPSKILTLNQADITEVEIKKKGSEGVKLAKNDAGKWQIVAPEPFRADQDAVSNLLSTFSALNADRLIEEKITNPEQYGLSQPAMEVDVTEKDKKTAKLFLGDETPTGSATYTALAGDPRVFTIASYNKNTLDKSVNDLRDKRLLTFDSDKLTRVELIAKKQDIEFGRNKDQWQILKPQPLRADGFRVDELVRTLSDAKMDLSGNDEKKTAAAFHSGALVATVKITDASGTQELQVRKNKDDYYAKSSAVEGLYKIASGTATGLDKSLDDFRNKKLFDFGYVDPDKVEVHDGSKNYFLTRSGGDWWSNGAKMDESSVSALVDKIRDLSASKFADNGFAASVLDVTVTSNDGRRIEKVRISKSGDRYLAKRENEPALYELDASAVTELQKSAADIKPSATPKK
jgi:uncharacterized protein DUF4340